MNTIHIPFPETIKITKKNLKKSCPEEAEYNALSLAMWNYASGAVLWINHDKLNFEGEGPDGTDLIVDLGPQLVKWLQDCMDDKKSVNAPIHVRRRIILEIEDPE